MAVSGARKIRNFAFLCFLGTVLASGVLDASSTCGPGWYPGTCNCDDSTGTVIIECWTDPFACSEYFPTFCADVVDACDRWCGGLGYSVYCQSDWLCYAECDCIAPGGGA
jgi:hypothetical protein